MARRRQVNQQELITLQQLMLRCDIGHFDLLLAGDGSGSGWNGAAGWACVIVESQNWSRWLHHGGLSSASVNMAEAMAYWTAMTWYHSQEGQRRLRDAGTLRVHILTDSEVTVTHGRQSSNPSQNLPEANRTVWAGIREFARMGYLFYWHHIYRCTNDFNVACDLMAGLSRQEVLSVSNDPAASEARIAARVQTAMENLRLCDLQGNPIDLHHLVPHRPE